MLRVQHVNEINDDYPADIAQSELAADGEGCLQIGFKYCFLEVSMPDKSAGAPASY